jgi:hypothetical protein
VNRNPQHCAHCRGSIEDAENWVLDRNAGYMHESCAEAYDEERQAQPAPVMVAVASSQAEARGRKARTLARVLFEANIPAADAVRMAPARQQPVNKA